MALVRILGALDLACAGSLAAVALANPLPVVQIPLAIALAAKGVAFSGNVTSRIDIACAAGMLALLWMPNAGVAVAIAVYLGVKGVASFT